MKITIIIPSCSNERIPLLIQTVESIQAGSYKNVHPVIVADGNSYVAEEANKRLHNGSVIMNKERVGWVVSTNRVLREFDSPYYIYAADDLIFPKNCIECAMATMRKHFPDGKGVVTLGRKPKAIFGLIGRQWVEHFPNRQVFCPYYLHYGADHEHTQFCKKIGKFAYPPNRDSQVKHFRLKDETCRIARSCYRTKDLALAKERKEKGLIWGISFDR
ncbi:glycosyltransferase family 2 protein [bacterium]|nr:glycosyltransferase family 2 protein [bacterium]